MFPNHFDDGFFSLEDKSDEEEKEISPKRLEEVKETAPANIFSGTEGLENLKSLGRIGPFDTKLDFKYQSGHIKLSANGLVANA